MRSLSVYLGLEEASDYPYQIFRWVSSLISGEVEMTSTNLVSFHKHLPLFLFQKFRPFDLKELNLLKLNRNPSSSLSSSSCCRVQAMMKEKEDSESQGYEIDRDKAREALQKLDQQLQSLSTKQVSSPKLRASEVKFEESERVKSSLNMREKEFEISDSFLGYTAVALVLFTIFYNFLFDTVIAPSIDGAP
ncbi:uncharacterized protein LOC129318362 [Prosopis cineraria]|uniref:uncharacterized protein LOC129318362 n=1 Tax=Prosopis cineraria TaxID=364024 RepID=UPI00240F895D|nr:uncharacterized protein LOC129318362 [Prosopis cineraria]